ncbi:MAG: hypothetical protein GX931_03680 [Acholeplasmataceae bacterium]|jgi:hypothetical protein|nr:hypothetical protein [Acholeplasmataceae bacterium]
MKKKFLLKILVVITFIFFIVGCDKKEIKPEYKIDVESITKLVGELGETFTAQIPKVLDKNGKETDYVASVLSVVDTNGNKLNVTRGRFLPNEIGIYTITYEVKDIEGLTEKLEIEIEDTIPPIITVTSMTRIAFLNETIELPTFSLDDRSGGDLKRGITTIKDPDGISVNVTNNKFVVTKPGTYTYFTKQYDNAGNEATGEYYLEVSDVVKVTGRIAYLDEPFGKKQVTTFSHFEGSQKMSFQTKIKHGNERGALKVEKISGQSSVGIIISVMEKDFTQFDYIGFWFYNDSNRPVRVYTILTTQEYGDGIVAKPKAWTYIAWDARRPFATGSITRQDSNDINELGIFIQDMDNTYAFINTAYYFGNIDGGKYSYLEDAFVRYDHKAGSSQIGLNSAAYTFQQFTYQTKVKRQGEEGSLNIKMISNPNKTETSAEGFLRLYNLLDGYEEFENFTIWIKNPNSFSIRVHNSSDNSVVVIKPGEEIDYQVTIGSNKQVILYFNLPTNSGGKGAKLPFGTEIFVGALRGKMRK